MATSASSRSPHALRLRGLTKTYRAHSGEAVRALAPLDLDVPEGQFLVVIGPTGCGKSTLLSLLAGLAAPSGGTVERAEGLTPGVNVPLVFQSYTLLPWRTILRNVAFGPEMRGVPRAERETRARALLERVGLAGVERAYPFELSGGMRQRAAIAQALAVNPRLLLMDEPFGAVDDATRRRLQGMIEELWRERACTVVFVTHNIDEAVLLADRIVVFSERPGRVVADLAVEDLPRPRDPLSPEFMERFLDVRKRLAAGVEADQAAGENAAETNGRE